MLPSTLIGGAAGQDWKSKGGIGGGGAGSGTVGGRGGEGGKGQSVASARSRSEAARRLPCWSPWLDDDGAALANHIEEAEAPHTRADHVRQLKLASTAAARAVSPSLP